VPMSDVSVRLLRGNRDGWPGQSARPKTMASQKLFVPEPGLHQPGTPKDFLRVLGQGEAAGSALVICAHGDADGFVFGEYAPGIDTSFLINGSMPAHAIAGNVHLPRRIVVSTACGTGTAAFAKAFIDGGVRAYIAPSSEPEGSDMTLFLHHLFYQLLRRRADIDAAWVHARGYDEQSAMFVLHGPDAPPDSDGKP